MKKLYTYELVEITIEKNNNVIDECIKIICSPNFQLFNPDSKTFCSNLLGLTFVLGLNHESLKIKQINLVKLEKLEEMFYL